METVKNLWYTLDAIWDNLSPTAHLLTVAGIAALASILFVSIF